MILTPITPAALRAFLDQRLGRDPRHNDRSYEDAVQMLVAVGFESLAQVEACISAYDDGKLSEIVTGGRQGQLYRFELMLMAALGTEFVHRHPWGYLPLWVKRQKRILRKMARAGIEVGRFRVPTPL